MRKPKIDLRHTFRKNLHFGTDLVQVNDVTFKRKWDDECGVNLGTAGFCCLSSKRLPDEANVRCVIGFVPPHPRKLIETLATLIWQKPHTINRRPLWYHGFRFTKLAEDDKHLIEQVLRDDP